MEINGKKIVRTYRVQGGKGRLHVTEDRNVYYDYPPSDRCSDSGKLPCDRKITKDDVCEFANCW